MRELLGATEIRKLAELAGVSPSKKLGQNFVIDANTVRRIVRLAELAPNSSVLEVGPGLGSLTLALLEAGHPVTAVELDLRLAELLPQTAKNYQLDQHLRVIQADALNLTELPQTDSPTALVANLPYNVSVPILMNLLGRFEQIDRGLVMVQAEVGQRLAAEAGSKIYGAPSVKANWFGDWSIAGTVSRQVFWPVPNVDSVLVRFTRQPQRVELPPEISSAAFQQRLFTLIDLAFNQRRKMLRGALSAFYGSTEATAAALEQAGIDPQTRGEQLGFEDYIRLAKLTF